MEQKRSISIVVPAYKQEKTIINDITTITQTLENLGFDYEVIVVVDGIIDRTYERAKSLKGRRVKVFAYEENHGKGFAVRFGMLKARGDIIGFIDSGMDINPQGISMLINHMDWYNADIIIGSKLHPVSKVNYPWQRKILSWGYRSLVISLFGLKIRDSQVGMKLFKRNVIKDILPRLLVKTYAFDIEFLAVSYAAGYHRIYEAPIEINFRGVSSITSSGFWKIIILMLWDTLAVFYRLKILRFYDKKRLTNK